MRHLKKSKVDLFGLKPQALRVQWSIDVDTAGPDKTISGFAGSFDSRIVPAEKRAKAQEVIEQAMFATVETITARLQKLIVER